MQALVVERSKVVWCQITSVAAAQTDFSFDTQNAQDIANANILVYAIEAITAAEQATDPYARTIVAAAGAPSLVVTWVDTRETLLMQYYPTQRLRASQNSGFPVYVNDFAIDLTKSIVRLVNVANVNANEVIGFELYYKPKR